MVLPPVVGAFPDNIASMANFANNRRGLFWAVSAKGDDILQQQAYKHFRLLYQCKEMSTGMPKSGKRCESLPSLGHSCHQP